MKTISALILFCVVYSFSQSTTNPLSVQGNLLVKGGNVVVGTKPINRAIGIEMNDSNLLIGVSQYGGYSHGIYGLAATSGIDGYRLRVETIKNLATQTAQGLTIGMPLLGAGSSSPYIYGIMVLPQVSGGVKSYALITTLGTVDLGDSTYVRGLFTASGNSNHPPGTYAYFGMNNLVTAKGEIYYGNNGSADTLNIRNNGRGGIYLGNDTIIELAVFPTGHRVQVIDTLSMSGSGDARLYRSAAHILRSPDSLIVNGSITAGDTILIGGSRDARFYRFGTHRIISPDSLLVSGSITAGDTILIGGSRDARFFRFAAHLLRTPDSLIVNGYVLVADTLRLGGSNDGRLVRSATHMIKTPDSLTVSGNGYVNKRLVVGDSIITNRINTNSSSFTMNAGARSVISFDSTTNATTLNSTLSASLGARPASSARLGGQLIDYVTASNSNSGAGETTLDSVAILANTMNSPGSMVSALAAGTFVANVDTKTLRVYLGTTKIFDSGALPFTAATTWTIKTSIINTGSGSESIVINLQTTNTTTQAFCAYTTAAINATANSYFKVTGQAATSADITQNLLHLLLN